MSELAIEGHDLTMRYGEVEAGRGIDLVVAARRFRWVPQGVGA